MIQIRLEPQVIIRMHHLMRQYVLRHALRRNIVCTHHDAVPMIKPAQHASLTRPTPDIRAVKITT